MTSPHSCLEGFDEGAAGAEAALFHEFPGQESGDKGSGERARGRDMSAIKHCTNDRKEFSKTKSAQCGIQKKEEWDLE